MTARPAHAQDLPPAVDTALAEPAAANPEDSIHFERVLSVDAGETVAYAAAGNFIYVGQGASIATVDVSNSNDPLLVGRGASLGGLIRHITVDGNTLYVAAEGVGLIVLDATQPEKLREVARFAVKRASYVAVDQGRAYVGDDWNGLLILDVGQPASPRLLGTLHVAYAIYGVSIANQRAFISLGWNGLMAADVADAAAPKKLAHWRDLRTWQRVEFSGQYAAIVLDGESLHLYDLSDLKSPNELAKVRNVDFSMVAGRYVYAGGWAGLRVWDLFDPVAPVLVQSINRPSDEAWVDLLVAVGHVYIRQEDGSILVFDLIQPAMPVRVGKFGADPSGAALVALSGDVLLAARSNSLSLFDLAQPNATMSLAAYTPAGEALALAVCSRLAAVVVDGAEPGLELVAVSASGQPSRAGFLPMPAALADQVYCAGSYVYAAQSGGLAVIDISQPDKPRQIGFFASNKAIQAAAFAGSQAYLLDADQKLHVLDLSAPAAPRATGTLDVGAAHDLAVAGGYVFVSGQRELLIVDVSDPVRPRLANQVAWGFSGTFDLAVEQPYLWAHDYYGQIFVYDITRPGEPVRIGAGLSQLTGAQFDVNASFAAVGSAAGGVEVFAWSPAVVAFFNDGQEIAFSPTAALTFALQPAQFQPAASDTVYGTVYGRVRFTYYRPAVSRSMGVGALSQLVPPFSLEVVDESSGTLLEPTAPFSVKVQLTAGQLAQVEPDSVRLYAWSGMGWAPLENSTLDAAQGILSAVTDELAPWTVLATPRQAGLTVFLPYLAQPPEGVDVALDLIELTQSTQTTDNRVPLVAGRATLARVYAHGDQPAPVRDLTLTLSARRDGALLPGSPLTVSSWAAFPQWDRGQYGMSFNFSLPLAWTYGNVTLSAELRRGEGALDVNLANNRRELVARFVEVPSLDLMLVPIRVIRTSGNIVAAPTQEEVTDWILRTYPIAGIRVAYHAPITFRGDLTTDREFEQLLQLVTDLRKSEGAPGARVYYGLLPLLDFIKWNGVGWVGLRASIGVNDGITAGHEIGHNFGRYHAPCGNPASVDAAYPYPEASIGQYGFDFGTYTIWQPVDGKDFMSYCSPRWTSDYTYVGLLADQLKHGAAAANAEEAGAAPGVPVLWLRATLRTGPDDGVTAEFLPLYALIGAPDVAPAEAACRIRLLGEAGQLLAEVAVEPMEAMDAGPLSYVSALVPAPAQAVVGLALACDGQPVASVDLPAPAATAAGVVAPHVRLEGQSVSLEWGPAEAPALVQMQAAGGEAWTTLGVDVTGGALTLDAEALPGGSVTFRVVTAGAGDAALQAAASFGAINLPDSAPRVWITGPSSGPEGASVVLFGHAFDAEDGVLEGLQWFVDGAPAGTGDVLQLPVPAAGSVEVSLSAVDSAGHTVIARHRLEESAAN